MMDLTSLQSIEEQLNQEPIQTVIQKSEYMQNLKSECFFKQNALKTAENLIEEYYRENEELRLQVFRLNQKIQNYEERIQILRHQVQLKDSSNAKTYQKELFKNSHKLSKVLEKYSQLQEKFHALQKQLIKYKFYKKENEERIQKEQNEKQRSMKIQIEKQFNNFLRTPINKPHHSKTNDSTNKKTSVSRQKNLKQLRLQDFQSESNHQNHTKFLYETSSDQNKETIKIDDQLFDRRPSIKKSAEKIQKMYQKKTQQRQKFNQQDGIISQKLKILEWRLKEKDQQIMLMLRRNKEIQGKYTLLKQILHNKKQSPILSQADSHNERKQKLSRAKYEKLPENQIPQHRNKQINRKKETRTNVSQQPYMNDRKITHFSTSLYDSTDNSTWKNYKTFKLT